MLIEIYLVNYNSKYMYISNVSYSYQLIGLFRDNMKYNFAA